MSNNVAFARTTQPSGAPPFVVDRDMLVRDTGRQIAWEYLDNRYDLGAVPIELSEAVALGETALTVVALPAALEAGYILDFGDRTGFDITIDDAGEAIGQTALTVDALPGPVYAGEVFQSGAGEFIELTADAAAGATSITVDALEVALEGNDVLTVPTVRQTLRVAAAAAAGDEAITVDAADMPIPSGAIAYIDDNAVLIGKRIKAGTIMCELANGQIVPRAVRPGSETAKYILATNADEDSPVDAVTGYGVIKSASIYENLLPESTGTPKVANSTYKTELLAHGGFWMFDQYEDNTNG